MELSPSIYNPYDFSHPVSRRELFSGRIEHLKDIRYYLKHAVSAPQPTSLALLGPRASGKTSLLNMIGLEAQDLGFAVVRVNLNETDASSELSFFFKIFDSIFSTVCETKQGGPGETRHECFGGIQGKTYRSYLEMVYAYSLDVDRTFAPFLFPLQYATALKSGNCEARVSDVAVRRDLAAIQAEAQRPIIVLFDECNVLVHSRALLEMMRNTFMNLQGYMLVVTGTPDLFPLIDEVFSPIVRQFKKIELEDFKEKADTFDCVDRPLKMIELDPGEVVASDTYEEIHSLSSGHPYEINLICHFMFRAVQEGRAARMQLSFAVLEDLRRELETSHTLATRPIIAKIKSLTNAGLSTLALFTGLGDCASFQEFWECLYLLRESAVGSRESLEAHFARFCKDGILVKEGDAYSFAGDDFEKIYCKYLARERRVELGFDGLPRALRVGFAVRNILEPLDKAELLDSFCIRESPIEDVQQLAISLKSRDFRFGMCASKGTWANLYQSMCKYRDQDCIELVQLQVSVSTLVSHLALIGRAPKLAESCRDHLASLQMRATDLDGKVEVSSAILPVVPISVLLEALDACDDQEFRRSLLKYHSHMFTCAYVDQKDATEAAFHAEILLSHKGLLHPVQLNNLGYWHMVHGKMDDAAECLHAALNGSDSPNTNPLASFNLGVCRWKCGNVTEALQLFRASKENSDAFLKSDRHVNCLLVPKPSERGMDFEEVNNPDLAEEASRAIQLLTDLIPKQGPTEPENADLG